MLSIILSENFHCQVETLISGGLHVQLRTEGTLEPMNAAALPPGGLRQDHHGYEDMPVSPADARPYSAVLAPNNATSSLTNASGIITLLVAPDNSSIVSAWPGITCNGQCKDQQLAQCSQLHPSRMFCSAPVPLQDICEQCSWRPLLWCRRTM